jgi:hypothetical protein
VPPKDNPIKKKLDDLAKMIVDDALTTESSIERLDAFKLLTNYYTQTTKIDNKKPKEDDDGDTFDGFRKSVKASGS